jgi:hypothetical protein
MGYVQGFEFDTTVEYLYPRELKRIQYPQEYTLRVDFEEGSMIFGGFNCFDCEKATLDDVFSNVTYRKDGIDGIELNILGSKFLLSWITSPNLYDMDTFGEDIKIIKVQNGVG